MEEAEFRIQDILPVAFTLVVAGIGIAYGLEVSSDVKEDNCDGTLTNWDSAEESCYSCPNSTYNTFQPSTNLCNNGSTTFNVSATEYDGISYTATNNMMTGVANVSSKFPTLGTIIVAAIIIGVLVTYLFVRV